MAITICTDDAGVKIYRQERQSKTGNTFYTYSLAITNKDAQGKFKNAYIPCRFKKGITVEDKSKIKIIKAFPTFDSNYPNGEKYPYWLVTEFEVLEGGDADKPMNQPSGFNILDGLDDTLPFV